MSSSLRCQSNLEKRFPEFNRLTVLHENLDYFAIHIALDLIEYLHSLDYATLPVYFNNKLFLLGNILFRVLVQPLLTKRADQEHGKGKTFSL